MPRISRIVSRISAGVGLIALAACSLSDDGTDTLVTAPSGNAVASVVVSPSSATLDIGRTLQLNATLFDASGEEVSGDVSWTSSDSGVAGDQQRARHGGGGGNGNNQCLRRWSVR